MPLFGAPRPRGLVPLRQPFARRVNNRQDFNLLFFYEVYQSVGTFYQLPHFIDFVFRHHASGAWEGCDLLGAIHQTLDNPLSVVGRRLGEIIADRLKLAEGRVCP
jgi:hypothetical protein